MNNMIADCPYCHSELVSGELHSKGGVFFLPDGETVSKLYTEKQMKKHNAIGFPPYVFGDISYPKAYVCRNCNKVIVDIEAE